MRPYEHGGNVYDYEGELIDFSSNINPLGMPKCVFDIVKKADLTRYPDIKYRNLKESIAQYTGISRESIIVGNGASELIHLFVRTFKVKRPIIPSPSFLEYERATCVNGGEPIYFRLEEEEGFKLNLGDLISRLQCGDSLIIGNPNNPTGQVISADEAADLLKAADALNMPVMIDEAFIEFVKECKNYESLSLVEKYDNLFVVRATTKFFGMPGLRLGYGIGNPDLIERLDSNKEPWTVNAFADLVGREIFKDSSYIEESRMYINNEIDYMLSALNKIDNLVAFDTKVNFLLLKSKYAKASLIKERLVERGILIRDASNFKYLDDRFFRVAVKRREENERLIEALKGILP